jgi:uncharacterized membrane protein
MKQVYTTWIAIVLLVTCGVTSEVGAQAYQQVLRAKVVEVISETSVIDEITGSYTVQELRVELRQGDRTGELVTVTNDYEPFTKGDRFFIGTTVDTEGRQYFSVVDRNRGGVLGVFVALFVGVIVWFGKKQGLRSLISLAGSLFMLAYVLIPSLLRGVNPMLASTVIATLILAIAIFFTHGFKRESVVALIGTVSAVIVTGILSSLAVQMGHFTGLGTEDAWYLKQTVDLDFRGLLLGGIMIGVLGVLDDIAVTQVSVVRELYSSAAHLSKAQIYKKALRVGQEHVGALVNTLALAYTGASLPLLLLFAAPSVYSLSVTLSQELFAVEIIRTIVGSIGLVLTVPITTLLAVHMLEHYRGKEYHGDHHGHSHAH